MWTKLYWLQVAERAVKTFAQAFLALIAADGFNLLDPDPATLAVVVGLPTLISILMSLVSGPVGPTGSPSLFPTPLEAGMNRLAAAARGLVNAAHAAPAAATTPSMAAPRTSTSGARLADQTARVEGVLDDLGQLHP